MYQTLPGPPLEPLSSFLAGEEGALGLGELFAVGTFQDLADLTVPCFPMLRASQM